MKQSFLIFTSMFSFVYVLTEAQTSQNKHLTLEEKVFSGNIMAHDSEVRSFLLDGSNSIYSLNLGYQTLPSDSTQIASDYNYPTFGIGFSIADFSRVKMTQNSHLGNIYSLYGFFDRTLFRLNRVRMDYTLETGLAYATNPYNSRTNPTNYFISSPIMMYVGLDLGVKYKITNHIEAGVSAGVRHYSNGRLGMPNKGINISGFSAQIRYYLDSQKEKMARIHINEFDKKWEYHVIAGMGWQKSLEEWTIYANSESPSTMKKVRFKSYMKYSVSGDAMYRFSEKYSLGLGLDLFITPNANKMRDWDMVLHQRQNKYYNPLSVGIAINQELYYKNVSLSAAFGYYALRQLGIEENTGHFYQRAGIRYYLPKSNGLFVGYSIKAHNFRMAEYLEFSIGKKF